MSEAVHELTDSLHFLYCSQIIQLFKSYRKRHGREYPRNILDGLLSFLLVPAGQDHPGASSCQVRGSGFPNPCISTYKDNITII